MKLIRSELAMILSDITVASFQRKLVEVEPTIAEVPNELVMCDSKLANELARSCPSELHGRLNSETRASASANAPCNENRRAKEGKTSDGTRARAMQ